MSKKPVKVIREAQIKRALRCTFTNSELLELSKRLAEKNTSVASLEEEKSRAMKDYAARIKTVENDVGDLSRKVTNGYEFRDIDCRVLYDTPKPGKKTIIRLDENQEVGVEDMSHEEKQMLIPAVEPALGAKAPVVKFEVGKVPNAGKSGVVAVPADDEPPST